MPNQTTTPEAQPSAAAAPRPKVRPRTDVYETEDALILIADVPGADEASIELALTEDVLSVHARAGVAAPEGWQPAGAEFELPDYERSLRLTTEIDRDGLSARVHNGRLEVVLKKRQPRAHRIEVRAG
ncbi:MAG: Hsp20/alpha crystallin family protein [Planctomycetes bacterium]|nr:Hsp20/alpha crystallin family protein [Planctomycetota bacterium]